MECAGFYEALGGHPPNKEAIEDEEERQTTAEERKESRVKEEREREREAASSGDGRSHGVQNLITRKKKQHLYQYR